MARPTKCRRICSEPAYDIFRPEGIPTDGQVNMTVDEYEVIRLIDLDRCTHEQCARQMEISRTTVTEIYESARYKLAYSIVHGKVLNIIGGNYRFCKGKDDFCCDQTCIRMSGFISAGNFERKGEQQMRIAVTYEDGKIFQHFGHTEQFKLYDVENGEIKKVQVVDTNGQGHGALASFLTDAGADVLICGGIGGGAQSALAEAGIQLLGGVSGDADEAVEAFINETLAYNPNVKCSHHEHNHGEGHTCGEHGCVIHSCH